MKKLEERILGNMALGLVILGIALLAGTCMSCKSHEKCPAYSQVHLGLGERE